MSDLKKICPNDMKVKLGELMHEFERLREAETEEKHNQQETINEQNLDELQQKIMQESKLLIQEVKEKVSEQSDRWIGEIEKMKGRKKVEEQEKGNESKVFIEKQFKRRQSLLDQMFCESKDISTLFNMCIASVILLMANNCVNEYNVSGKLLNKAVMQKCFSNLELTLTYCAMAQVYSYLIVILVQLIDIFKVSSSVYLPVIVIQQSLFYLIGTQVCTYNSLNIGSATVLLCECSRLQMKTYSYFRNKLLYGMGPNKYREYIPTYLKNKGFTAKDLNPPVISIQCFSEELSRFTYFLFAPTLLYRDQYPRRRQVDLLKALKYGFFFLLGIYYMFLIYEIMISSLFQQINEEQSVYVLVCLLLKCSMPATALYMLLFWVLLHCWFNLWGELLKFEDCMFYEDWWNSLEFGTYYRKWNTVVHEWLYHYVYTDLQRFTNNSISKNGCQLSTFLMSAFIHEIIITYALGFFYPILFLMFTGPGILLIRNTHNQKNKDLNIFFWFLLFIGLGILLFLYLQEYQARVYHTDELMYKQYGIIHFLIPRSIVNHLNHI